MKPIRSAQQAFGEQADIEAQMSGEAIFVFLILREQVEQKSAYTVLAQFVSDELVPRTVPTAPAAMSKENHTRRVRRNNQLAVQLKATERDLDFRFHICFQLWHIYTPGVPYTAS